MIEFICGPRVAWASRVMRWNHWHDWLTPLTRYNPTPHCLAMGLHRSSRLNG